MERASRAREARDSKPPAQDRIGGSFLVRVWYEAREVEGGAPAFRGYVKDLRTGEELFLRDPETVKDHILERVEGRRIATSNGRPAAAGEEGR